MMEPHEAILAVEDTDDDVALIRRAFRKVGIRNPLLFVGDGEAAMEYLEGKGVYADRATYPAPALVLLDLKLPRLSGLEVLERMRAQARFAAIPVVVLTSSRHAKDLQRAYELGANSYLVKPVDFADLIAMIDALRLYWINFNEAPRAQPGA